MTFSNIRLSSTIPLGYIPPAFPSLYWPINPHPTAPRYLYYPTDIWKFTLFWTLISHAVCFGIVGVWGWAVTIQGGMGAVRRGEGRLRMAASASGNIMRTRTGGTGMSGAAGGFGGNAVGMGGLFGQQNRQSNDTIGSVGHARSASNQSRRRWKGKEKARDDDDDDDDDNGHENSSRIPGERGKGKAGTSSYGGQLAKNWLWGAGWFFAALIVGGIEAVIGGSVVGLILAAVYNAGYFRMSTWIPFVWGVINMLVLILSSFSLQGGL